MAENERMAEVGEVVIFTDSKSVDHNAIVTIVWGMYCINLIRLSDNPDEKDQYGRQIKRETSVQFMSETTAHGNYFRYPNQEKKEYAPPVNE